MKLPNKCLIKLPPQDKTGRHNVVQRIVVDGKSENVGVLAKKVESLAKEVNSRVKKLVD